MIPAFFKSQTEWHKWLAKNHASARECWVGFYKVKFKEKGISYKEALDEALAFGWIDAVRKSIDDDRWMIRFTPRKPRSIWSNVNTKRVNELKEQGLMQSSGLKVFALRDEKRSGVYSFERESA